MHALWVRVMGQWKWLAGVIWLGVAITACALSRDHLLRQAPAKDGRSECVVEDREGRPLVVLPTLSLRGALEEKEVRQGLQRLRDIQVLSMSHALHMLRLFGPGVDCEYHRGARGPVLDIILDDAKSRDCFHGKSSLIDTRYGVRSRVVIARDAQWQLERQAHEDQLLAVLGESGVALSRLLTTSEGTRSVRHILDDTLANFSLRQPEIEWSVLAMLLYLPTNDGWADKFGKSYHFDDVAQELIDRPISDELPCGGTHLLYTMTVMLRVSEQEPILSPPIRERIRATLQRFMAKAVRSQSTRGSWGKGWYKEESGGIPDAPGLAEEPTTEVLLTGHQLEWLMLLPADMRPQHDCFLRALRWLEVALLSCDRKTLQERYCPYSHAGRVLKLLILDGSPLTPHAERRSSLARAE